MSAQQTSLFDRWTSQPESAPRISGHGHHDAFGYVVSSFPSVKHRVGTAREKIRRPMGYLYMNWSEASPAERVGHRPRIHRVAPLLGVVNCWTRMSGEATAEGRRKHKEARKSDRSTAWMIDPRRSMTSFELVRLWCDRLAEGGKLAGCQFRLPGSALGSRSPTWPIYADTLGQLVLASLWVRLPTFEGSLEANEGAVRAAIGLSLSGHGPRSDGWTLAADQAQELGVPWGVPLARLGYRPPDDPVIRALADLEARP